MEKTSKYAPMTLADARAEIEKSGLEQFAESLRAKAEGDELHTIISADFTPPAALAGPLAGIPIAVKDNVDVTPFATTGGSAALKGNYPAGDAGAIRLLRAAGAWIPAKLNMHELAMGVTSDNASFGPVLNPFDLGRTAGGSSGGSGAAVASGIVPIALGTDTGASVRIPASFCGVAGFRPSTGRYPGDGVLNLSTTRDTIGILAASVADIAEVDAILAPDDASEIALPDRPLRLGMPADAMPGYSDAVEVGFRASLKMFADRGLIEIVDLPSFSFADCETRIGMPMVFAETLSFWNAFCEERLGISFNALSDRLESPDVKAMFGSVPELAEKTAADYGRIMKHDRANLQASFGALFGRYGIDLVVAPTTPVQPPRRAEYATMSIHGKPYDTFMTVVQNTTLSTLIGTPSLTIPIGLDQDGLPLGMLLDGPIGSDRSVLAWARRLEDARLAT